MQTSQTPVWARDHTILGICEALGEDFRFNPLFLRIPLAVCLLLNPWAVAGTYAALGVLVAFARLAAPDPKRRAEAGAKAEAPAQERAEPEMALAA